MSEQLAVVREWWQEIDQSKGNLTQPVVNVAKLLVDKKIAAETETAKRIILTAAKKKNQ